MLSPVARHLATLLTYPGGGSVSMLSLFGTSGTLKALSSKGLPLTELRRAHSQDSSGT